MPRKKSPSKKPVSQKGFALAKIRRLPHGLSLQESSVASDCLDPRSQTCACSLLQITSPMPADAFNRSTLSPLGHIGRSVEAAIPRISEYTQSDDATSSLAVRRKSAVIEVARPHFAEVATCGRFAPPK